MSSARLRVSLRFDPQHVVPVGEMLRASSGEIFFQYDPSFLQSPLPISPFKLRDVPEPQIPLPRDGRVFDGLFGVFADSLPDGWGLLLMSRKFRTLGKSLSASHALERLAFVGSRGAGALIYEPAYADQHEIAQHELDLARLAEETTHVLAGTSEDVLSELIELGGSAGGARPKVLVGIDFTDEQPKVIAGAADLPLNYEHWIIKFAAANDDKSASIREFVYSETARHVGINFPPSRLFRDRAGNYWFGVKRFDRLPCNRRLHMSSVAGLAHADFRLPSLDYDDLLKLTRILTRDEEDVRAMFRLAAFNVLFNNRDDHAKNFAFLMHPEGTWRLAPAFDLTHSQGPGGEHTTSVGGEGKNPTRTDLYRIAKARGIPEKAAIAIVEEVADGQSFMDDQLRQYGIVKKS